MTYWNPDSGVHSNCSMDEALAPTPSLSPETVAELNQLLAKESWTKNRQFFVNPDSITISLFDNLLIDETLTDVPLHFKDIPIIPHHFSHLPHHFSFYARDFASVALETSSETENHVDGLSPTQLHKLTRFVNGIVAIDFYLDRQVVVSLPAVSYVEEVQRLGFDTFSAWNCVFHLNCSPTWERKPSRLTEDDLAIFTQGDVIAPGSTIFSSTGEPSVIGVFLVPRSRTQDIKEIQYFTVCAHSFVRMKSFCLELNGRCALRVIIILFVAYCIWDSGASELLPIYQHFCLSRGVVMAQECMFGPPLVRNPVVSRLAIIELITQNEGAKPSMPTMPMLLLDLFLMAPGILRLMIVTSIHDFGLERLFLLSIRWDLLMEFSLVFWFLLWAWKTPFLRETFVRSFMMQEELICIPHTLGRLCPLLVSLRIPFSIPFFAAWCGRFVLYFSNRSLLIAPLVQYIGLFFICWDILQLVWYLEFPSSFTVLQQIVSSSHEKVTSREKLLILRLEKLLHLTVISLCCLLLAHLRVEMPRNGVSMMSPSPNLTIRYLSQNVI